MINAQQIIDEGLLKLENTHGKPSQVGYDLSLKSVNKIGPVGVRGNIGKILKDKTELTDYIPVETQQFDGVEGWLLHEGSYDITFHEGCQLPANRTAFIRQRSSLLRNGAIIASSIFDPGFETQNIGTIMKVNETIFIQKDARIAQIYFHENTPVNELYNGSFQNDKQRDPMRVYNDMGEFVLMCKGEEYTDEEVEAIYLECVEVDYKAAEITALFNEALSKFRPNILTRKYK